MLLLCTRGARGGSTQSAAGGTNGAGKNYRACALQLLLRYRLHLYNHRWCSGERHDPLNTRLELGCLPPPEGLLAAKCDPLSENCQALLHPLIYLKFTLEFRLVVLKAQLARGDRLGSRWLKWFIIDIRCLLPFRDPVRFYSVPVGC